VSSRWHASSTDADVVVVACEKKPIVLGAIEIGESSDRLVYGSPLDEEFVGRVQRITTTEAILLVDGEPILTSFGRSDGEPLDLDSIDPLPATTAGLVHEHTDVLLPGYAGFRDEVNRELHYTGAGRHPWYVGTRALDADGRVALALYAPEEVLSAGPRYALAILVTGSVLVLVALGIVIRRLITRYTGPLEELAASARHVAQGDLSREVDVPDGHEMAEFCGTYNEMLEQLSLLISARNRLAREAGMAEVAAGVLHNVGNAMTSVGTGVALAREQLEDMPIRRVVQLASLLRTHSDDLPGFLAETRRQQMLLEFVDELAAALQGAHGAVRGELDIVDTATRHTMQIVAAQQRHARCLTVEERCDVAEAIEDAIRICGLGRADENINIVRNYTRTDVHIDRNRTVQIIVNLLSNAKDALHMVELDDKRIWVELNSHGGRISIIVRDNGCGIRDADREKIFSMGFTTKPQGHGFGLHASFNTAAEIGGALRLLPAPEGGGAAFELSLAGNVVAAAS
jgi:nitrogen fixation/metabolism regulation signal transduction histidine kinase